MRLALLGIDDSLLRLAEAVARDADHQIDVVCDDSELAVDVLRLHQAAERETEWESLLLSRKFDVVVVGTSAPPPTPEQPQLRVEQLRRFVQERVPTVLVQPAAEAIVLHELAMIQHDTRGLLTAWNPVLAHPAVKRVNALFPSAGGEPPAVSHVSLQRVIDDPDWTKIKTQLSRDAQWVRQLMGPPDRVTALAPQSDAGALRNLAVTIVGPTDALAQWTLASAAGSDSVTLAGPTGQTRWTSSRDGASQLQIDGPNGREEHAWTAGEVSDALGDDFLDFVQQALERQQDAETFDHACRAMEVAEAAQESNRRSRTIHLHYEEHSEQQTFKSVMAAGGCFILLAVLCVLGGSIAIDSIGAPVRNNPWWRIWPVYLLAPIVIFLLLQTLWRVFSDPPSRRGNASPPNGSEN